MLHLKQHVREFEYCGRNALQLLNLRKIDSAFISLPEITQASICEHHAGGGGEIPETFPSRLFILIYLVQNPDMN